MEKRHILKLGLIAAVTTAAATYKIRIKQRWISLQGKTVVITGGSRGLGLVLAREFLHRRARVALVARDAEELQNAQRMLSNENVNVYSCDVTQIDQVFDTFAKIDQELNGIDILVNNAGNIQVGPSETMTPADYRDSLNLHFWAPYFTCSAVLPGMKKRKNGRIVNISSIGGKISVPHLLPYSVGKFALAGFSEGLRFEVIKDNIFVTTIYPGLLRTGSPRNAMFKGKHTAEYTWFSISDALPGVSMSATRAAKQVINACERGDARAVLSLPAKFAVKLNEIFPEMAAAILAAVNRFLPSTGGIGRSSTTGEKSFTSLSPSFLTTLNERAAQQNNQVA